MKKIISVFLFCLMVVSCAGTNQYHQFSSLNQNSLISRGWTLKAGPELNASDRGFEWSSIVLNEDLLIYLDQSAKPFKLVAVFTKTKEVKWSLEVSKGVKSPMKLVGSSIYLVNAEGYLHKINSENGHILWKSSVKSSIASGVEVAQNRVYVNVASSTVYCFDDSNGNWIWSYKYRNQDDSTAIHSVSEPLYLEGLILVGFSSGSLVLLDAKTGTLKTEKPLAQLKSKFKDVDAKVLLNDGVLYVPSYDGQTYALDQKTLNLIWKLNIGGSKTIVADSNFIYISSALDRALYQVDKKTGKIHWKFELDQGAPNEALVQGEFLVLTGTQQYMYLLKRSTGELVYRFNVGDGSGFNSAAKSTGAKDSKFYAYSGAGNVYQFILK